MHEKVGRKTKNKIKALVQITSAVMLFAIIFSTLVFGSNDEVDITNVFNDASHIRVVEETSKEKLDISRPMIALSFDDGPAYTYEGFNSTQEILNVLEYYGARATFFMCGTRVNEYNSTCLERELALGCEIGNHTYDHTRYGDDVTADDIKKASEIIKKYCGEYPTIFRCPGGIMTAKIQAECKKEGMPIAYWSVDTEDWSSQNVDLIYDNVMENAYDGAIILMHDIYPTTAKAVKKIVPELMKKGYQIVTVSELIKAKNDGDIQAGQQYIDSNTINNNT